MPAQAAVSTSTATTSSTTAQDTTGKTMKSSKPVPLATVRSSKLAAMAANMKKNQEVELGLALENYQQSLDDAAGSRGGKDESLMKLENILIVPDMMNEEYSPEGDETNAATITSSVSSLSGNSINNGSPGTAENSPDATDMNSGSFGNLDFMTGDTMMEPVDKTSSAQAGNTRQQQQENNGSKNMSLSCVNPGSMAESNYRLGLK